MIRLIYSVVTAALVYPAGAFVAADWNAWNWSPDGRALIVGLAVWAFLMVWHIPEWGE
jgi:hypothetical protein